MGIAKYVCTLPGTVRNILFRAGKNLKMMIFRLLSRLGGYGLSFSFRMSPKIDRFISFPPDFPFAKKMWIRKSISFISLKGETKKHPDET